MAEEEEDPFGAFGEDSDNDESDNDLQDTKPSAYQDVTRKRALDLDVQQPTHENNNIPHTAAHAATDQELDGTPSVPVVATVNPLDGMVACHFPSWEDPVYLTPHVRPVSSLETMGGSRGLVALAPLAPGTLVLVESALMMWPEEQLGQPLSLRSVQGVLEQDHAATILACLEDFHPTKTTVDAYSTSNTNTTNNNNKSTDHDHHQVTAMMESLRQEHQDDPLLEQLVQKANSQRLRNRNGTPLTTQDIVRIYLALRYNGLESGLYCYMALLNHDCQPNSVKFLPSQDAAAEDLPRTYSEVRTTRWIAPGECLTISYVPRIVSHATRRHHLWEQHRFDIGLPLPSSTLYRMEVVQGRLPESSLEQGRDQDSVTFRIEKSLEEMDALYQTTKDALSSSPGSMDMVEQAKALELSSLELYQEARQQVENDRHILLLPCLVLHLDACHLVLETNDHANNNHSYILNHQQRCLLLGRMIVTGRSLLELQRGLYGEDHFDVARTNLDLSQAIQELLAKSPDTLLHLLETAHSSSNGNSNNNNTSHQPKTFRDWSTLEYQYRRQHERIKALYPRDAHKYIPIG